MTLRVLIIQDSKDQANLIARELQRGGHDLVFERVDTAEAVRAALVQPAWDLIIAADALPDLGGPAVLRLVQAVDRDLPVIIVSDAVGGAAAVTALEAGAFAFVPRDDLARLAPAVQRALDQARVRRAGRRADAALRESERRYRFALDAMSDPLHMVDADLRIVLANAALRRWGQRLGLDTLTLGSHLFEVFPFLPDTVRDEYHQVFETGKTLITEEITSIAGQEFVAEIRKIPIIEAESVKWVLTIVRDVAARKRVEEEQTQLLDRTRRQQATLVRLASHPALAEGRLDEALRVITEATAETLKVERSNVWQLSLADRTLRCLDTFELSLSHHASGRVIRAERYPRYFAALESGRVVDASDVRSDPRTSELSADAWEPLGISSSLSAPVRLHADVVGLVCYDHVGLPRQWTPDEVAFAGQVSDLVARVFLNADLRRRADELAAITRVSREITSVPDLRQVLASIARHAAELGRSDASGVFAFRSDGRLYIEAGFGVGDPFIQAVNAQGIPLGQGAIGRASAQRRPVQIPDILTRPGYPFGPLASMEQIRSILATPMLQGDETMGGIVLWHRQPRHFAPEELAFLQALAQQCVNAVENARLFEAEARRRREAETLQAVTQALSATLDLERVLELILSELQQAVPYDCASVQRLEGDVLQIVGGRGFPDLEELLGVRFDVTAGDNPNRQVIHTRAPVVLDDAPASYSGFNCEPHVRAGVRSWLGVPLLFGDRLIGMIALDKREPGFYTQQHARMAQAFAAQAAIAMENARLFAQEEQRAAALSQALEQQRELDRLKDQFIQNVSHELRTPLALIQGYIDLLQSGELGELQPRQREPVSIIARRTRLLNKLVENLMAILETVTQNSERESVDLAELVERLRADFEHAASQAGLTLTTQIASNLPPIFGDPAHLYQVLDNLLANAVKFTSAGGHITVRVWREDAHVVIEVADTGVGIPKAELDRVFERFYQVDGSMSRRYGGAGLGLALVKEIVEAHGGSVSVQSHVGQGTSFRVSLPASAE